MENETVRQCYICLESVTAEQLSTEQSRWVSPCVCAGSMAWVHQSCVLRWIEEQEESGDQPVCRQCGTVFTFTTEKGQFFVILDFLYKKVVPACRQLMTLSVFIIGVDTAICTLGTFALTQLYGVGEMTNIIRSTEPLVGYAEVHVVAYFLIFINYLPWEEFVLKNLRKWSKLRVLRKILPADAPRIYKAPLREKTFTDIIGGAVLTPVFARIVGNLLFSSVESTLGRFILGGVTFLVGKGVLSMYVNQKLMKRRQEMDVLPVEEVN